MRSSLASGESSGAQRPTTWALSRRRRLRRWALEIVHAHVAEQALLLGGPSQALGASTRWTKLSSASNVRFRPKNLLKLRPPDGPIYVPSPSYDLQQLPASVDVRGSARGRFHRRADKGRR